MMPDLSLLAAVRRARPLVHCVSNIVAANDCANLALAVGASPIMAQAPEEMADISAVSDAVVLNLGTPSEEKFKACLLCAQAAARRSLPVVVDPVGVGASPWRLGWARCLLGQRSPAILHVNLGEAQALLSPPTAAAGPAQGVDSPAPSTREKRVQAAIQLARQYKTVALLSGPEDVATDGDAVWLARGGSAGMAAVTGTGCMLSTLCGVLAAVEKDSLRAAAQAAALWKLCAARAEKLAQGRGPGSLHAALFDAAAALANDDALCGIWLEQLA